MANRVSVKVGGVSYSLIADETPEYVQKLAAYLDARYQMENGTPAATAAVLAGLSVVDELFQTREKSRETESQIREYEAETVRLRGELAALKRELRYAQALLDGKDKQDT